MNRRDLLKRVVALCVGGPVASAVGVKPKLLNPNPEGWYASVGGPLGLKKSVEWRNYTGTYGHVDKEQLLAAMRQAMAACKLNQLVVPLEVSP